MLSFNFIIIIFYILAEAVDPETRTHTLPIREQTLALP